MQTDDTYAERINDVGKKPPPPIPLSGDAIVPWLLLGARVGAITCDVPILATVVTSLVSRRLRAVGGDVTHAPAVEATAVSRSRLVDHLSIVALQPVVGAITSNVPRAATVVASLLSTTFDLPATIGGSSAGGTAGSTTATTPTTGTTAAAASTAASLLLRLGRSRARSVSSSRRGGNVLT
jgi:hypothetical protein